MNKPAEMRAWLKSAKRGDWYVYAAGVHHLTANRPAGNEAWSMHQKGRVILVQKRTLKGDKETPGKMDYIMVKV